MTRPKSKVRTRAFRVKSLKENGSFEGYGSVFNVVDTYRDMILPGAFEATLAKHAEEDTMPPMLWQHDTAQPIGKYEEMREDEHGLFVKGQLLVDQNVPMADTAYSLLKADVIRGLSIGFNVPRNGEEYNEEHAVWEIKQIDLWEVSIVTFPANRDATISDVKDHLLDAIDITDKQIFERFLRDVGLSKREARALMSRGYDAMVRCDASTEGDELLNALQKLISKMRGK